LLSHCPLFSFNYPAPTEIYTLSLHDALPICEPRTHSVSEPPTGARRRSPSPRPGVPPANLASPSARECEAPAPHAALAERGRGRTPALAKTALRAAAGHPGAGI